MEDRKRNRAARAWRTVNAVVSGMVGFGLGPPSTHLLTTRGNQSGFLRTTPVDLVEGPQGRFLVAPYGPVGWVRNIRTDGFATLRRGGWIELITVREVEPERAAPVLRDYVSGARALVVGRAFGLSADSPLEDFAARASKHPVFEIVRSTTVRI
ncbi:nitroreductase/quinone reductase family protein [Spiractinospora alimapuensis]|uniref:nitroreductase/quinone reductase family protein n=1 Tax=Spiractinospora alimapuensis TaxID=2820884 RepID=UPI0037446C52